ncbi:glycosyltransferase family 4 protein [Marinicrinis lubricantis]|uniref:Glycosyltransferase family 4 protein n=1 Tax=Marinicrinis lubricantis TaxID=2086470 RepID=A0ABW1IJX5_9BACL
MKRLFISMDFPPDKGGIQDYTYGLVSEIDPSETYVLTRPFSNKEMEQEFDKQVPFTIYRANIYNNSSFFAFIISTFVLLASLIRLKLIYRYREIHFVNSFPIGLAGLVMKYVFRVPYYCYIHGLDFKCKIQSRQFPYFIKVLHGAKKIIANSSYTKLMMVNQGIPEHRISIIAPGLNTKKLLQKSGNVKGFKERYGLNDKKVLITVARLVERKGHDVVLKALPKVVEQIDSIKYVICGTGPYKDQLSQMVEQYRLSDYVVFTGELTEEELNAAYQSADIFIMPSREIKEKGDVEGFGIVFLEANYYKVPVIGGNSGGIPDAIVKDKTGFLIDPLNEEEIAQKILTLLQDEKLAYQMGESGYFWVVNHCLWKHRVKLLDTI